MKSKSFLVLACLVSMPVFAQSLPDEINYAPYQSRYQALSQNTDAALAKLAASQKSLDDTRQFIQEMTDHLASLQSAIESDQGNINSLNQEIPALENKISYLQGQRSQIESNLRVRQNEDSQLNYGYQAAMRNLQPLEADVARKTRRLAELQNDLGQFERTYNVAQSKLQQTVNEANRIDRAFEQERSQQNAMEQELRTSTARQSAIQSSINQSNGTISGLNSNLASEKSKLDATTGQAQAAQAELARLQAAKAPAAEIRAAQQKVAAIMGQRNNLSASIRSIQGQISKEQGKINSLNSQLNEVRRNQTTLPGRIAQSKDRQRQLTQQRGQIQASIDRFQNEASSARRNMEIRRGAVEGQKQEVLRAQNQADQQRAVVNDFVRKINAVRAEIDHLSSTSQNLSSQIAEASNQVQADRVAIPQLEQDIRTNRAAIASGQKELRDAEADETTYVSQVALDQQKLNDATHARDAAQIEMNNRLNLYQTYQAQAEKMGSDQGETGTTLGDKEGARLSGALAKQNGQSVGRELGEAEARLWGSIRGELKGYDQGHAEGLASVEDQVRAKAEAGSKAAQDAELYAQRNDKPIFFEEYVQAEFKKPLAAAGMNLSVSLAQGNSEFMMMNEMNFDMVNPPSQNELRASNTLTTPLDASIAQAAKDVQAIKEKAQNLGQAEVAFVAPASIPYGSSSCNSVYKGLSVFKAICDGAYRGAFANNYVSAAHDSFVSSYSRLFTSEFDAANVLKREQQYSSELSDASKISEAEGLRVGKIEIYNRTYESTYKTAYESSLVKAKAKAKNDASREFSAFIKSKPLLTFTSSKLTGEEFRGGEEVVLEGQLKNVGQVAMNAPVLIRVTEVQNAEMVTKEAVVNKVDALSMARIPALKVKILPTSKAGEKLVIKGTVDLPGDLYRPARQEKFELVQILAANPANEAKLVYDNTPDIKGIFRRNLHFFDIKIQPTMDNVKEGYEVSLKAVGNNASLININEKNQQTGSMTVNSMKQVRYSYTFKDEADGKVVNLEMTIMYRGKIIKSEVIELRPH